MIIHSNPHSRFMNTPAVTLQVHSHHAAPHEQFTASQLPRSCAYLLHFYCLWGLRTPQLMATMGAGTTPGVPLQLQEVLPPALSEATMHL